MKTLSLEQGSPEWLEHRASTLNASEAPAMLGLSPYMTRAELLRMKYDGFGKEVDAATQRLFDRGHETEAAARPIAEEIIGEELYPATVTDDEGRLGASLDGMTMDGKVIFEHKLFNDAKAQVVSEGKCPEQDYPQVQQGLLITGAERCLYAVSDGTKEGLVSCWVYPDQEYQDNILAGWEQFQKDLEDYEPTETQAEVVGRAMESMPALNLQVEAKVLATNIDAYKAHAIEVFESINTDLQTDQDFADAETAVKFCKDIESRLTAAKDAALAQAEDLYNALRSIDDVSESARQKRLALEKLVKARKEARRSEIQDQAVQGLSSHYQQINETLPDNIRMAPPPDFRRDVAEAMKGKRTITSLIDSADQALADAKLDANAEADTIRANLKQFDELAGEYKHLFADLRTLVGKQPEDFTNTVKLRISEHNEAEAKREQERKEAEERRQQAEREAEQRKADDQAHAALQQQADHENAQRSTATDPSPPEQTRPVADGAGTGQRTERVKVTATFVVDVPEGTSEDQIRASLNSKLTYAGFRSIQSIEVEKVREAA